MRLLIITQKVDKEDPLLGFFHNWILELSHKFESLVVMCLEKGSYDLPQNVKVLSLGKESGQSKLKYLANFYKYIWQERKNYDSAFVHMNQEYIILGWKVWKLLGKKIYFWRNHKSGNLFTRFAVLVSEKVFYTSPDSFTARYKKSIMMPVGIDTELFTNRNLERKKNSILSIGRISPIKNIHLMIEAAKLLQERGIEFNLDIVGDPINKEDFAYKEKISRNLENVSFHPGVPNHKTPGIYSSHDLYINLTPSGSMDKTILEAAASGCIPIVANVFFKDIFDEKMLTLLNPQDIANKIEYWLKADEATKQSWRTKLSDYVLKNHSLNVLIERLSQEIV